MFKRLLGTAIATAAAALGVKVVRDILQADEEAEKIYKILKEKF